MPNTTLRATCRWLLWIQIVLTASAVAAAVTATASDPTGVRTESGQTAIGGVADTSPLLIYCVVLLAGGGLGLVVVHRVSHTWRLAAGVVLIAPAVLAVGCCLLPSETVATLDTVADDGAADSLHRMLIMLDLAYGLAFLAVLAAAAAGVLILLLGRTAPQPPAGPPSAS